MSMLSNDFHALNSFPEQRRKSDGARMGECKFGNRHGIWPSPCSTQRRSENSDWSQLDCGLCFGCHDHGFAWPCLRYNQSTATQSRDRGTLKTSHFFPDSLSHKSRDAELLHRPFAHRLDHVREGRRGRPPSGPTDRDFSG